MQTIKEKIVTTLYPMTPEAKKKDQKAKRAKYMKEEYRTEKKYLNCALNKSEYKIIKSKAKKA